MSRAGAGVLALVLAGVAISSLADRVDRARARLRVQSLRHGEMVLWMMGSLKDRTLTDLAFAAPLS